MSILTTVLPNNYLRKDCPYLYKIVDSLPVSFFINNGTPTTYVDFDDLILSVFDVEGTEVQSDVHSLSKVDLGGGEYRIYAEDIALTGLGNNKTYRFVIYDSSNDAVLYILNWFEFVPDNQSGDYVYLSYRNSSNIFNFNYEELPDYRNKIFVDLNVIDNEPEYDLTNYAEASTGFVRNQKSQLKDSYTLEAYFFDKVAHGGMKGLSMHDDIEVNFRPYQVKEGYEIDTNIRNGQSKGSIQLYDQNANEINLNI